MLTKRDVVLIREVIKDELDSVHKELGSVHNELDSVHKELGSVHNELDSVHKELGSVHNELDSVHKDIRKIDTKLDKTIDAFDHMHLDVVKNVRMIQKNLEMPIMDLA